MSSYEDKVNEIQRLGRVADSEVITQMASALAQLDVDDPHPDARGIAADGYEWFAALLEVRLRRHGYTEFADDLFRRVSCRT